MFAQEIAPLRADWLRQCEMECNGPDASTACGPFPGDPVSCGLFDSSAAQACYLAYRAAIKRNECTAENRSVKTIEDDCGDVYDDCEDPMGSSGGSTGDSSGGSSGPSTGATDPSSTGG